MNDALDLPGVLVAAKSPNLQGTRTTVTGASGDYIFSNVPPGEYTITFTLSGFQTQTKPITLASSQVSRLDVNMSLTAVSTTLIVSGKNESISQTTSEATTYTAELLSKLPTARTITSAVLLSPGINNNAPNGVSIAGAQSTENLYTVNGVVVSENVRGQPFNLFIEDAIQETTTTTSTVSAEFGRFTGGVINTITKSGGNTFSGSVRTTLTDDAWGSTSKYRAANGSNPQEGQFVNTVVPTYEATLGGPILKDKIWFFGAGRFFDTSDAALSLTRFTNIPYTSGAKETRYEGKLTISPFQNHTLTASYVGVKHDDVNYSFAASIPISDLASIYNRQLPQEQLALNYNGVITNSFFLEAQYSKRKFTFENSGGSFTDFVQGTVIRDLANGVSYNAPIFCGICGPEKRDSNNWLAKGTYFLSTQSLGSHNIVGGYDNFGGQRLSNNYQSGSNFVLYTQAASIVQGTNIYPVISAETHTELDYWPVLLRSQGSDLRTVSAFLNDTWRLNNRLSFNVGVRYDKNDATDAAGNVTSKDSAFSPRLAGMFDVLGDGKLRVTASYAKYVAALQETQAGSGATLAGTPADFYWYYDGPGINTDPTKAPLSPNAAMQQVMNWFTAGGCLPNPLAASCTIAQGGAPAIGGVNVQIQNSLASPNAKEYVLGFQGNIGSRGTFRADAVRREFTDFYDLKKDMTTGRVTSPFGAVQDLGLVVNSSDYRREYTGLHTQFSYRLGQIALGGIWTWSHLIGNIVGENSGSGPIRGGDHVYPEYFSTSWENPVGDLSSDTRHRVRLYGSYDLPIPARFGALSVGAIESWDTGNPYGAVGTVDTRAYVTNPGYLTRPASENYYFTPRDAFRTQDIYRTDLSMNFSYRIGGAVEIWVAPIVVNVFNSQHVMFVNQAVETRVATGSSYAAFNPFTTVPTQGARNTGANWNYGPLFGQPTGPASYQTPRYFSVSVGARF